MNSFIFKNNFCIDELTSNSDGELLLQPDSPDGELEIEKEGEDELIVKNPSGGILVKPGTADGGVVVKQDPEGSIATVPENSDGEVNVSDNENGGKLVKPQGGNIVLKPDRTNPGERSVTQGKYII